MKTQNCVSKLFFKFMGDDCSTQLLTVTLTEDGHAKHKFQSGGCRITKEHDEAISAAFSLFNTPKFEAVYKIEFDGGITDGICAAALHADLLA